MSEDARGEERRGVACVKAWVLVSFSPLLG